MIEVYKGMPNTHLKGGDKMAAIRKRGNTYQIRVFCGYDVHGKQVEQTMTWKPSEGMTKKQIEKELNRQAVLFEEACMNGQIVTAVKFEDFARQWFKDYAEIKLKTQTIRGYHFLEPRIYKSLGHIRIDKITPRQIQKFVKELTESDCENKEGKLSAKSVKLHISLVSTIFDYAVKMQMVKENPCRNVTLPKPDTKEREIYTIEEAQQLLKLFEKEDKENFKYVVFYTLAMYTGLRKGELLGLEWKDFDFDNRLMTVVRTSMWAKGKGMYTDTPKTKTSQRVLRIPENIVDLLKKYKEWQNEQKSELGDKWQEHDRLFTTWNGMPMDPTSPYYYFKQFCKRTGMRYVTRHSFRHFHASAMISSGVDVKTVQSCLGHSSPTTTMQCYLHSFQTQQALAMDAVANMLNQKPESKTDKPAS